MEGSIPVPVFVRPVVMSRSSKGPELIPVEQDAPTNSTMTGKEIPRNVEEPGEDGVPPRTFNLAKRLSIVIPALNEEQRLPGTLVDIVRFLRASKDLTPAEILVIDDGSSDNTAALVEAMDSDPEIEFFVFRHPRTMGKGAAIRTGFSASRGGLVLISDADLSTPIEEIRVLLDLFSPGSVVIGSRAVDRSLITRHQPFYRDRMGRIFNFLVRSLVLSGIFDTQCGFKIFEGKLARNLAVIQKLDGFAYDVELLYLARRWGYLIREAGVRWAHVEASRVLPGRHSVQMFKDLLILCLRRISGRYPAEEGR